MNRARGYTLTEMMVTVAIVGILSMVAAPLLVQMTNFWRQTTARNIIQRDVRASLDVIDRFCRQAKAGTVIVDQAAGQPPFSRISFTSVQGQNVSFFQSGSKLFMQLGSTLTMLSSNVAFIAFTYPRSDDTSIISVAITTQASTYLGGTKALQLSIQKVRIMN
ncbi:MAG: type II secretion system protein [Elusimicrobia bacterium]|nr:type II secretion system protein [Elusimicrobiota bacterium]